MSPVLARFLQPQTLKWGGRLILALSSVVSLTMYVVLGFGTEDPRALHLGTICLGLQAAAGVLLLGPGFGTIYGVLVSFLALLVFPEPARGLPWPGGLALMIFWLMVWLTRRIVHREGVYRFRLESMIDELTEQGRVADQNLAKAKEKTQQDQRKWERYRNLERISGEFNSLKYLEDLDLTVDTLLQRTLEILPEKGGVCVLRIFETPEHGEWVRSRAGEAGRGRPEPVVEAVDESVRKVKRPMISHDLHEDIQFREASSGSPYRSVIAVPLLRTERLEDRVQTSAVGVLRIDSRQASAFTVDHLRTLSTLGDLAGALVTNALLYQVTQKEATTDALTGLYVQRYFKERFDDEVRRAKRQGSPVSFLMLDVDHFKNYNDSFGHLVGDLVLKSISRLLKECTRNVDFLARYGGEEFAVILPETDLDGAVLVAERIRQRVEETAIAVVEEATHVTVSIGVAAHPDQGDSAQNILVRADEALYKAKAAGRNRVMRAGPI